MDKWDEITTRVRNGVLAEEPEAALVGALELLAEFGRTLETVSADLDRIATAMERVDISGSTNIADVQAELTGEPVHDL